MLVATNDVITAKSSLNLRRCAHEPHRVLSLDLYSEYCFGFGRDAIRIWRDSDGTLFGWDTIRVGRDSVGTRFGMARFGWDAISGGVIRLGRDSDGTRFRGSAIRLGRDSVGIIRQDNSDEPPSWSAPARRLDFKGSIFFFYQFIQNFSWMSLVKLALKFDTFRNSESPSYGARTVVWNIWRPLAEGSLDGRAKSIGFGQLEICQAFRPKLIIPWKTE